MKTRIFIEHDQSQGHKSPFKLTLDRKLTEAEASELQKRIKATIEGYFFEKTTVK